MLAFIFTEEYLSSMPKVKATDFGTYKSGTEQEKLTQAAPEQLEQLVKLGTEITRFVDVKNASGLFEFADLGFKVAEPNSPTHKLGIFATNNPSAEAARMPLASKDVYLHISEIAGELRSFVPHCAGVGWDISSESAEMMIEDLTIKLGEIDAGTEPRAAEPEAVKAE